MLNLPILFQIYSVLQENPEPVNSSIVPIEYFWQQVTALNWLEAVIAISFGTIYLFYGWRIFRVVVVISFGLLGMYLGLKIGGKIDNVIWGGIVGFGLAAAVSLPLMRWAVSTLGAVAGGILSGSIWYAFDLPEKYILAGALIGAVAGGMISFIVFKYSVMLFTSLQGGALIVAGGLALMNLYMQSPEIGPTPIQEIFFHEKWFLPLLLLTPAIVGLILQNKFVNNYAKWDCDV